AGELLNSGRVVESFIKIRIIFIFEVALSLMTMNTGHAEIQKFFRQSRKFPNFACPEKRCASLRKKAEF
ncbi:hypothetical protein, partial [Lewinella cohaerens]|uniref:hypothetical protein n=1 Tax=Lewinella cohaerens TaxID=70995 RepID=UPI0005C439BF